MRLNINIDDDLLNTAMIVSRLTSREEIVETALRLLVNANLKIISDTSIKKDRHIDPYGICADIRSDLSFDEFQKNRQELWGNSTDEEIA